MLPRWILTGLLVAALASPAVADTFTVTVKAVGADGKPEPKAATALFWSVKSGVMTPAADKPAVTGPDGRPVCLVLAPDADPGAALRHLEAVVHRLRDDRGEGAGGLSRRAEGIRCSTTAGNWSGGSPSSRVTSGR